MAELQHQRHYQAQQQNGGFKSNQQGPSASKILAVVTLLPVGGTLLCLAGLAFAGSLLGLLVTTPLFIICSPVLVPAAITIALAVAGFLASGAFGITALSSMSWMVNYLQRMGENLPLQVEHAKRRVQETTGQVGQKAREMGQTVHEKAKETAGKT